MIQMIQYLYFFFEVGSCVFVFCVLCFVFCVLCLCVCVCLFFIFPLQCILKPWALLDQLIVTSYFDKISCTMYLIFQGKKL